MPSFSAPKRDCRHFRAWLQPDLGARPRPDRIQTPEKLVAIPCRIRTVEKDHVPRSPVLQRLPRWRVQSRGRIESRRLWTHTKIIRKAKQGGKPAGAHARPFRAILARLHFAEDVGGSPNDNKDASSSGPLKTRRWRRNSTFCWVHAAYNGRQRVGAMSLTPDDSRYGSLGDRIMQLRHHENQVDAVKGTRLQSL